MTKMIFEGNVNKECIDYEDGGAAVIVEPEWVTQGGDDKIFVRIQSWDESIWTNPLRDIYHSKEEKVALGHESIQQLFGKKIRVTVEVID